jgi:hypothetical protein
MKDIIYTRKYTDQKGQERKEYITLGYIFEKDGKMSILMKPWINLGSLANEKCEVWLNVYEHKTKTQENTPKLQNKPQETQVYDAEPTVATVAAVVNEGKQYAEKWAEMAEAKKSQETDEVPF